MATYTTKERINDHAFCLECLNSCAQLSSSEVIELSNRGI